MYTGKDRQWQDAFARYIHERGLGFFYWCLNPNSEDTGGLLRSDWKGREQAKLQLLGAAPSSPMSPLLQGRPPFKCLAEHLAQHFRCADGRECILQQQVCNGFYECHDHSDEASCPGVQRPCVTTAGEDLGRPCSLPFMYNGFQYSGCTLVDAVDAWLLRGVGLCQHGFMASLSLGGETLAQCKAACARTANCSMISYTAVGGGYCSSYTASCGERPLNGVRSDYKTYELTDVEDAGAWCPTEVDSESGFLQPERSGVCGPGCPLDVSGDADDPRRSQCNGASQGRPTHCKPSPPPPPSTPPPPYFPPPPARPPLSPPPVQPPPSRLTLPLLGSLAVAACAVLLLGLCVFAVAMCKCLLEPAERRRSRRIYADELEVLSHSPNGDGASCASGRRFKPVNSPHGQTKRPVAGVGRVRAARDRWENFSR